MKTKHSISMLAVAIALTCVRPTSAQTVGPAASTTSVVPTEIAERLLHQRAVEAVIWGMPVVNYDLMYQAAVREAKGGFNQIIYWSRLPDWKIL